MTVGQDGLRHSASEARRSEMPPPGGLLTVAEAAQLLGVSEDTAYRMVHRGCFRVYWPTPRRLWIFKKDVDNHIAASVIESDEALQLTA